jgi:hypothetical protein
MGKKIAELEKQLKDMNRKSNDNFMKCYEPSNREYENKKI